MEVCCIDLRQWFISIWLSFSAPQTHLPSCFSICFISLHHVFLCWLYPFCFLLQQVLLPLIATIWGL